MFTIASLIEQIEADRRAVESSPTFQQIRAALGHADLEQKAIAAQFELSPGFKRMIADFEATAAMQEKFLKEYEALVNLAKNFQARTRVVGPEHYWVPEREYPVLPNLPTEPGPLPKRSIVRREVKRKIGFKP